jgi:hypothetical protein
VDRDGWIKSLEARIEKLEGKVEWLQRIATLAVAAWAVLGAAGTFVVNWLFGGKSHGS